MALPMLFCNIELKIYVPDGFEGNNLSEFLGQKQKCTADDSDSSTAPPVADFMAALSDPGGFSKGAEKQAETMKGLGIEQTDAKAEAKKKKEEEAKKGIYTFFK